MNPTLWDTLYKLSLLYSRYKGMKTSTTKLAEAIGLSQQTVSRHLIMLEKLGLIERRVTVRGEEIRVNDKGLEELRKVEDARVQGYLRIIDGLNLEIHEASEIICSEALNDESAKLLMTIPGISFYSALLLISEIGDVDRFPDSAHLASYAGLTSSTHSSGGSTYPGRITKAGSPYLRWVLNQCAWVHVRNQPDGSVASFYRRLRVKKGHAKAMVAASVKLLKIVYWVLREKRAYQG
jgi:transposase